MFGKTVSQTIISCGSKYIFTQNIFLQGFVSPSTQDCVISCLTDLSASNGWPWRKYRITSFFQLFFQTTIFLNYNFFKLVQEWRGYLCQSNIWSNFLTFFPKIFVTYVRSFVRLCVSWFLKISSPVLKVDRYS